MRVVSAESTELFVGPSDAPLQLVRVAVTGCTEPAPIRIHGDGLAGEAAARPGDDVIEVAVAVESPVVGERRTARVHTPDGPSLAFEFTVAEPGWTMFMISHFHYDPVWWNTQGAYTSQWREDPPGRARQANGFELVRAHLEMARREPEYKFVLAEVDYLKPYWDTHPQDRADLRRFLADGRIEVMGGTYNEPNTNLTSPETTIRNLVHGIGFQRDVLGAEPATAWQLDVFGHDPQFPGLAADAGLTSSSWARGPHHQWGPAQGGVDRMQFCSEFEWIAPSGRGLLTHYMPAHYSAGWSMDSSTSLADAEAATYALFDQLKKVALTRNVLLPVGTDYTPPNKWVTAIHRDWVCSSACPAQVQAYRGPLGQRLVVRGRIGTLLRYTQTLTLWDGVDRVDCRTSIDEFTGEDRLLRLRWPCPVPGAMPISEVGDAVVGRGFALLHEGPESVDTAQHPWTLDNPAYGWFGLSSAVRVRAGDGVRAVSVAEVVSPTETVSGPMARDLMVALVRAGVTATCSGADKPRYGHLDVDSNLPDARIALGGPDRNTFTKAVLAEAAPAYTAELQRQLAKTGTARVWVPAANPLARAWLPGADLRAPCALPVLVIDGRDEKHLRAAVASLADDLADAEIVVHQRAAPQMEPFEDRTVALLNRGVPSFAVDSEGTLHTALMRSCTGWPSGVWIDQPRRTAPDGSNFQLQHWTHHFDYALVCGGGDWRRAGIPARSAQFSHPLLAVAPRRPQGELPAVGSLLHVEPADSVQLGALKAAGNPLAAGSARPVQPAAVALRLVQTTGADTPVTIGCELGKVGALRPADLLETPLAMARARKSSIDLHGYQVATVLARLDVAADMANVLAADDVALAPHAETAQPQYARYWLHNRGPAPLGGLPAVAHLHPRRVRGQPGDDVVLRLTAASDCTDSVLGGVVDVVCPLGWPATPARLPFTLGAGAHLQADIALSIPAGAPPGPYPVRAQLRVVDTAVPAAWRQVVEDVCVVTVGADSDLEELVYLVDGPADIELAAGDRARLAVTIGSRAHAELALDAHSISPWGTWEWIGPPALGAVLPARGMAKLAFDVTPPAWLEPGQWWALVRVGCAGQLVYSPAVKVSVT